MKPYAEDRPEEPLDTALKSALEPEPESVDRVLRQALAKREAPPAHAIPWRLATVAAALALVAFSLLILSKDPPTGRTTTASEATAADTQPARLSISNASGLLTVTTPAGSKMVLVQPATGDIS